MADDLGVSRATLSRWMNGRSAAPRRIYLRQWALHCGVSFEWLCHGDNLPCGPEGEKVNVSAGQRQFNNRGQRISHPLTIALAA
jgi:transcriptional regulator with XRE-family HTH domain